MKDKDGKKVPNCVPESEQIDESAAALKAAMRHNPKSEEYNKHMSVYHKQLAIDAERKGNSAEANMHHDASQHHANQVSGDDEFHGGESHHWNNLREEAQLAGESISEAERSDLHYKAGYDAHQAGKPHSANPYTDNSIAAKMWQNGHEDSQDKKPRAKFVGKSMNESKSEFRQMLEAELMELSKKTLGSYIKKAGEEANMRHSNGGYYTAKTSSSHGAGEHVEGDRYARKANASIDKADKRTIGIHKAVDKLTK